MLFQAVRRFSVLPTVLALVFVVYSASAVSASAVFSIPDKIDGIDFKEIDETFTKALDKESEDKFIPGDADAQYKLGVLFYRLLMSSKAVHQGFNRDAEIQAVAFNKTQAEYWLKRAAYQNYAPAQYLLGNIYYWGFLFTESDHSEAEKFYRMAAENGHAKAQAELANLYLTIPLNGESKEARGAKAFDWAMKSAQQGNALGMKILSQIYKNNVWGMYDPAKSEEWEKKAEQATEE